MPGRPDDVSRLSGSRLCEIAGVNRQTRDKWAQGGLLRKADDYDQLDLVELVALKSLLETLPKKHAKLAWRQVRPRLRELMPARQLTLVWDPQRRAAELAYDATTIVELVSHGRLVQVLELGTAIDRAREAFRRDLEAVAAVQEATQRVQQEPSRGHARRKPS